MYLIPSPITHAQLTIVHRSITKNCLAIRLLLSRLSFLVVVDEAVDGPVCVTAILFVNDSCPLFFFFDNLNQIINLIDK